MLTPWYGHQITGKPSGTHGDDVEGDREHPQTQGTPVLRQMGEHSQMQQMHVTDPVRLLNSPDQGLTWHSSWPLLALSLSWEAFQRE